MNYKVIKLNEKYYIIDADKNELIEEIFTFKKFIKYVEESDWVQENEDTFVLQIPEVEHRLQKKDYVVQVYIDGVKCMSAVDIDELHNIYIYSCAPINCTVLIF